MALFRKKPAQTPAATGSAIDPLLGDPDAHRFRGQLADGRWHEFHQFLEGVTDWPTRHWYVRQLAEIAGRPAWLDEWVAARPDSAIPMLFRGVHGGVWAWEARGSGYADTVKKDAWAVFHSRLVAADQDLARAAALDPKDPCPLESSLPVARGLSLGEAEGRRRFDEAHRRDPWNLFACVDMIQVTAKKWGGSHEAMFEFARSASAHVPEGSSVHRVIPGAHIEKWMDLRSSPEAAQRYFRQAEVRSEINSAAAKSIRSANFRDSLTSWATRNCFAFCFYRMGDVTAAKEQLQLVGPRITHPWTMFSDPMELVQRARGALR